VSFCQRNPDEQTIVYVNGSTQFVAHYLQSRGIQATALREGMDGSSIGRHVTLMAQKKTMVLCLKYSTHSSGFDFPMVKNIVLLSPSVLQS
jgi:hypothetical protein